MDGKFVEIKLREAQSFKQWSPVECVGMVQKKLKRVSVKVQKRYAFKVKCITPARFIKNFSHTIILSFRSMVFT